MNTEIERGRTRLWFLLGAVCLLFLVNVFYPLYPTSTNSSDRMTTFSVMAVFAMLASGGRRWARISIGVGLLVITLVNLLVLVAALSGGQFVVSLAIGVFSLAFASIGWLLLTSENIRAFEADRQPSA